MFAPLLRAVSIRSPIPPGEEKINMDPGVRPGPPCLARRTEAPRTGQTSAVFFGSGRGAGSDKIRVRKPAASGKYYKHIAHACGPGRAVQEWY